MIILKVFIMVSVCIVGFSLGIHFAPSLTTAVLNGYPLQWIHVVVAALGFATYKVLK